VGRYVPVTAHERTVGADEFCTSLPMATVFVFDVGLLHKWPNCCKINGTASCHIHLPYMCTMYNVITVSGNLSSNYKHIRVCIFCFKKFEIFSTNFTKIRPKEAHTFGQRDKQKGMTKLILESIDLTKAPKKNFNV
jgi:hypothetical protein